VINMMMFSKKIGELQGKREAGTGPQMYLVQ
jgi:hypothetical protein